MYIVVDRKTKKVIHVNPAPLDQELSEAQVYSRFERGSMEIVRSALRELPERFEIKDGELVETPSGGNAAAVAPPPFQVGRHEKVVDNRVVPKSLAEQVADGLLSLDPGQKVEGDRIVDKTLSERVAGGLVKLERDEKLEGERIVKKPIAEQLEEKLTTLAEVKKQRIARYSAYSLQLRAAILPDYKLQNAALGIYDAAEMARIRKAVAAFRDEFHRLEKLVEGAKDLKAIEAIKEKFPRELP